jgi:hypothetical protein
MLETLLLHLPAVALTAYGVFTAVYGKDPVASFVAKRPRLSIVVGNVSLPPSLQLWNVELLGPANAEVGRSINLMAAV